MSCKRKAYFTSHKIEIPSLGDTRWHYRSRTISVLFKNNYQLPIDVLEKLVDEPTGWDDPTLNQDSGLLQYLNSFLFCFLVCLLHDILEQSAILFANLQNNKINLLDQRYGPLFDMPMLQSQLIFLYRDFHKESSMELLKYIFQFNVQYCLSEVVKLLIMNGVFTVSSASVERSFSCLKRVKTYLRTTRGKNRLSCLCRISIHKDILKSMEDANQLHELVLTKFVQKPRRFDFLYK